MPPYLPFLKSQKIISLACHNETEIWTANLYVGTDEKGNFYFISPEDTKHSQMILKNPNVAFSFVWFDPTNYKNRKGIQGQGTCHPAVNSSEIMAGIKALHGTISLFREFLTLEWLQSNTWKSKVWILKPTFIKYWDDEIYGETESEVFILPLASNR